MLLVDGASQQCELCGSAEQAPLVLGRGRGVNEKSAENGH